MLPEQWNTPSALWLTCKELKRGTLLQCVRGWAELEGASRTEAYVQTVEAVRGKRRHRSADLTDMVQSGLYRPYAAASPSARVQK
jgi:hypothetical protein